jgi:hypothetical protein
MSFITKEDLTSVIFEESIDVITRGDDTKVQDAIYTAVTQAARYLLRFDTDVIFAATGEEREKYSDLVTYIKNIAKWHLVTVCNAAVDMETTDSRYKASLSELQKLGKITPKGWPMAVIESNRTNYRSGGREKFNHE